MSSLEAQMKWCSDWFYKFLKQAAGAIRGRVSPA